MTNFEYWKNLPLEDVAELLITIRTFEQYDYDYDENLQYTGLDSVFVCSDGEEFEHYEEALDHEIWWLQQERLEDNKKKNEKLL